jgi:hypothetical protein
MSFFNSRLVRKRLSRGYATLRELAPVDNYKISKILGEEVANEVAVNNALVAVSLVSVEYPNPNSEEKDYMILDKENPVNYIKDDKGKPILDPENPYNYELDEAGNRVVDPNQPTKKVKGTDGVITEEPNFVLDSNKPYNYLVDQDFPDNYIPDPTKMLKKVFAPINNINDLMERQCFPACDWTVLLLEVLRLNEANPHLLGK